MKYRVTNISYDILPEDVEDRFDRDQFALESDFKQACEDLIDSIIDDLPTEMDVDIEVGPDDTKDDIEDKIGDAICDKTDWLLTSFKYKKIKA